MVAPSRRGRANPALSTHTTGWGVRERVISA